MDDTLLQDLRNEIALLKKMLSVLMEQNDALKAENSRLQQLSETKTLTHSLPEQGETIKQSPYSLPESQMTTKQSPHSLPETQMAAKQLTDSLSELHMTTKQSQHSLPETQMATKQLTDSLSQSPMASKQILEQPAQQTQPADEVAASLPASLPLSGHNISILSSQLYHAKFGGWKNDTTLAAAKLLLHFYNQLPGDYPTLRKLTGYSEGGLGKLLMNLRQKGYLIKTGFQQHSLTGRSLEFIKKAGCK
ncbi:MAG: hypothetical protein IPN22_07245 [Bacteroidetes bacterium]|nr:hypothetical protein [Bacteroidota bacterium]